MFDYQVRMCIKNEDHLVWKEKLQEIYKTAFEESGSLGQQENKEVGMKKDRLLEALEKNNQQAIQIEQIKQRDLLSKRLISLTQMNKKIEEDRDDIFVKIQSENTSLINECNNLRKDRYQLKRDLGFYQKSLKQIIKQIEHLLKGEEMSEGEEDQQLPDDSTELIDMYHNRHVINKKSVPPKELPFVQYQKQAKDTTYLKPSASSAKVNDELMNSNRLLADLLGKFDQKDGVEDKLSIENLKSKVNKFLNYENVSLPQIQDSNLRMSIYITGRGQETDQQQQPVPGGLQEMTPIYTYNLICDLATRNCSTRNCSRSMTSRSTACSPPSTTQATPPRTARRAPDNTTSSYRNTN